MKTFTPSSFFAVMIIATQVLGPAGLWAAEQRGIRVEASRQIIVSGLNGNQLTLQRVSGPSPLQFRDVVPEDARVTTGVGTTAELLLSNRAVLTLGNSTTVQVRIGSTDQTMIQVATGAVRLSTAASALGSQGLVTVQTPTTQVQTRGGILRVVVDRPAGKSEHYPNGAQAYRASYTPELLLAAAPPSDLIQVEEGTAEIPGVGSTGGLLTVQAGQRVMIQAGRAGSPTEAGSLGAGTTGIPAITGHAQTPKEGRDYLVALQVTQATKLGQALTGAAETGQKESEKKSDTKNVINGATGGVTVQDALAKAFGTGPNAYSGTGGSAQNQSGTGAVDDSNDGPNRVLALGGDPLSTVQVKGGSGLLLFTELHPQKAQYEQAKDPTGTLIDRTYDFSGFSPSSLLKSNFQATKELLFIDGGANRPLGSTHDHVLGRAPVTTLIARGVSGSNTSLPLQGAGTFSAFSTQGDLLGTLVLDSSNKNNQDNTLNNGNVFVLDEMIASNANVVLSKRRFNDRRPVVENIIDNPNSPCISGPCSGGRNSALTDYSNNRDGLVYNFDPNINPNFVSYVDGSITARSDISGNRFVTLDGGVVLDKATTVSLGRTAATDAYFANKAGLNNNQVNSKDANLKGSLLAVMASQEGDFKPAFVKIQDRLLGVLDGSSITETGNNKTSLLSVLDSRLIGPEASDPSTGANGRKPGEIAPVLEFDGAGQANRDTTKATVTSAVMVRATDVPLDGALLSASSPLLAMMQATMITKSHFIDLAGNNGQRALSASLVPGDALVRLNNATLTVTGNLLNLNNATAVVTGYLFSLTNGSTLQLNGGSLFSLNNSSSLTLTANAFGVFGDKASTLAITNNLCSTGPCGDLVNSAGQDIKLNGATVRVAGVSQDVVLPNNFSVFAGNSEATVMISQDAALFKVDKTSTLNIVVPK